VLGPGGAAGGLRPLDVVLTAVCWGFVISGVGGRLVLVDLVRCVGDENGCKRWFFGDVPPLRVSVR